MDLEEPVQSAEPSLQLEPMEVDTTLQLNRDPPSWPGGPGWQAPEPQPVNIGLSVGNSSWDVNAQLHNALLAATIGVTVFFALVLVVILAKLYQTFDSPLTPALTVESQLSYLTSSVVDCHQHGGRIQTALLVEGGGRALEKVTPILEDEHSLSAIREEEEEEDDSGIETKY